MRYGCPNSNCQFYQLKSHLQKDGMYFRKNDSRVIQRYRCKACGKRFSNATFSLAFGQKKRRVNYPLFRLLSSGVSMRRSAKLLRVHRKTVERKLKFLALLARKKNCLTLECFKESPSNHIQFDDLITIEHTKLKPLSVTVAVDVSSRKILSATVSQIPAFGHLAKKSVAKYGYRKSTLGQALKQTMKCLTPLVTPQVTIETDEHKLYPSFIKSYFPKSTHLTHKGAPACVVGQGELKKKQNDPLFAINHTLAMLRANIHRLFRRTWNTTKLPQQLQNHLDLYIHYHNTELV